MTTMVCFRAGGTTYCVPVEATRAVRTANGMVRLPDARDDVAGLIPGSPPLAVLSTLGAEGDQVLVVDSGGKSFGLLVEQVLGLRRVDEGDIRPGLDGQARRLVSATVQAGDELMLLADPEELAGRL